MFNREYIFNRSIFQPAMLVYQTVISCYNVNIPSTHPPKRKGSEKWDPLSSFMFLPLIMAYEMIPFHPPFAQQFQPKFCWTTQFLAGDDSLFFIALLYKTRWRVHSPTHKRHQSPSIPSTPYKNVVVSYLSKRYIKRHQKCRRRPRQSSCRHLTTPREVGE